MIVEAVAAGARTKSGCARGATPSRIGCPQPFAPCTKAHAGAYRRHAYDCVAGRLRYDWSQRRRRAVRKPACTLGPRRRTPARNGDGGVPAWGTPAPPWMPERSLEATVERDPGDYAEWGVFKAIRAIDPRYVGPVLVRGRRLDGDDVLRFEQGGPGFAEAGRRDPAPELRERGGYVRPAVTPGCDAYQVDGIGFGYSIVFRALDG